MTTFYRGAGVDTHWHLTKDATSTGFIPGDTSTTPNTGSLTQHISRGTTFSPYVSLTRSYGVAWTYAVYAGHSQATRNNPGFVYQVELTDPLPPGLALIDPVLEIAQKVLPLPIARFSYQHDGEPTFLLGVVDPMRMRRFLQTNIRQPPSSGGIQRSPNLTVELETIVRALRDAEILAAGDIPSASVLYRHDAYP